MTTKTSVFLYKDHVSSLREAIEFTNTIAIDMLITPLVNPLFHREYNDIRLSKQHIKFTRSDLILEPNTWAYKVICKLSDSNGCDSADYAVRMRGEAMVRQEMNFAQHLTTHGTILLRLNGTDTLNLARVVSQTLTGKITNKSAIDMYI